MNGLLEKLRCCTKKLLPVAQKNVPTKKIFHKEVTVLTKLM